MKTNSKLKLGILTIALALFPLLASETAFAGGTETATGTLTNAGNQFINLAAGNSVFTLDLNISTNFSSVGITYFLVSNDASGLIAITARSIVGSPYQDLTTSDAVAFTGPNGLLDPVNNDDLGATSTDVGNPSPGGNYFINTLTLSFTGAVAGQTYHIVMDPRDIIADATFQDVLLTLNTFTINVIPEPATTGLAVLGGVMLLGFVWRARRATA